MGRGLTRSSPAWMVGLGPTQTKKKEKESLLGHQLGQPNRAGPISGQPIWLVRSSPFHKKREARSVGPHVGPTRPDWVQPI